MEVISHPTYNLFDNLFDTSRAFMNGTKKHPILFSLFIHHISPFSFA
jgi:hypothetical protein